MGSSTSVAGLKLTSMVFLCMVAGASFAQAAITCGVVALDMAPCLSYLTGGSSLSIGCCTGVRNLNSAARATPDRRQACTCLKDLASSNPIDYTIAAGLPGKCGVNLPYKISPSIDCNTIN